MPCARGMHGCRADCLHRRKVLDYRVARHAAELAREQATGGYAAELAEHAPLLTFRQYLIDTAGEPQA